MRILKKIIIGLLLFVGIVVIAFFILKQNPKPEIIALDRRIIPEEEIDKMAREAVGQITIEEKVQMMSPRLKSNFKFVLEMIGDGIKYNHHSYQAGGNERLNIPTVRFHDGPRGMVSGQATCFPVPVGRAASFDTDLEFRIGEAIGREIRANEANYFGGVCINLLRHQAGGRAQEGYGEDSYMAGQMGSALMRGVQKLTIRTVFFIILYLWILNFYFDLRVSCISSSEIPLVSGTKNFTQTSCKTIMAHKIANMV